MKYINGGTYRKRRQIHTRCFRPSRQALSISPDASLADDLGQNPLAPPPIELASVHNLSGGRC